MEQVHDLPVNQVAELRKKHVRNGTEVLLRFILTELHEDQLFVSDIRRATDHQSSFLQHKWKTDVTVSALSEDAQ